MIEPSADPHIDASHRARDRAWGAAFATALLSALIGGGAALNDAPDGDRPSGILILVVLALAGFAVFPVRRQPLRLARRFVAIGILQICAGGTMMVQGWGDIPIIALINGILVVGWLLAAALFSGAARQFPAA
jgi:CHASE2 domain-containing sensor protein